MTRTAGTPWILLALSLYAGPAAAQDPGGADELLPVPDPEPLPDSYPEPGEPPATPSGPSTPQTPSVPPEPGVPQAVPPPADPGAPAAVPPPSAVPTRAQITALKAEIDQLEEEYDELGLGGSIAMMAVGGGVALFSLPLYQIAKAAEDTTVTCDPDFDPDCAEPARGASTFFAVTLVGGAVLAGLGVWKLVSRVRARRPVRAKLHEKREALKALTPTAHLDVGFGPGGGAVALTVRF